MIRRSLLVVLVVLSVSLIWIYRPYKSADLDAVAGELKELEEPFKIVDSSYYMDGGTVGVHIIDSKGHSAKFCLPANLEEQNQDYGRLFYGVTHLNQGRSYEIDQSEDTIIRLLEIMRNAGEVDQDCDVAIATVSGRWRDYSRILWRRFISREYEN